MSSPIVSTFQPGKRRLEHCQVGFATGRGKRRRHITTFVLGRGEFQDQHVLGEPAFVTRNRRSNAESKALLAQQCVAAVAEPNDQISCDSGKWQMYLLSALQGHATSLWPSVSGAPTECRHLTKSSLSPRAASTASPMRVIIRILTTT